MRAHLVPQVTLALRREALTRIRKYSGISSEAELAALMGIDKGTLSRVLLGKSEASSRFIAQLMRVLGMEYMWQLFAVVPVEQHSENNGVAV